MGYFQLYNLTFYELTPRVCQESYRVAVDQEYLVSLNFSLMVVWNYSLRVFWVSCQLSLVFWLSAVLVSLVESSALIFVEMVSSYHVYLQGAKIS